MTLYNVISGTTGSPSDLNQVIDALTGKNDIGIIQAFVQISPPGDLTAAVNTTSGNLTGAYQYKVAFLTGYWQGAVGVGTLNIQGNTSGGTSSNTVSPSGQQVDLTNIPIGGTGVVARIIYRTKANGSTFYFLQQINDNTTTDWTDNIADSSLDTVMPTINTTGTKYSGDGSGLAGVVLSSEKGTANGVATLDTSGTIPNTQIPENAEIVDARGVYTNLKDRLDNVDIFGVISITYNADGTISTVSLPTGSIACMYSDEQLTGLTENVSGKIVSTTITYNADGTISTIERN